MSPKLRDCVKMGIMSDTETIRVEGASEPGKSAAGRRLPVVTGLIHQVVPAES